MFYCECAWFDQRRGHRRMYIRDGAGFRRSRKYTWLPIGYYCVRCKTVKLDDVPGVLAWKE